MKKQMKTVSAVMMLAMMLTGCRTTDTADYYNNAFENVHWFSIGEVIYRGSQFSPPTQYHSGFDAPLEGLCRDPLCTHEDIDTPCPDYNGVMNRTCCTDGEKIYFSVIDHALNRRICSINPDGSEYRLLLSAEYMQKTSHSAGDLIYSDDTIYYQQSMYDDATGKESIAIMCLSVHGGTPEEALDMRFEPGIMHFVDRECYYILDITPYYAYEQSLTVIDRETGRITENIRPEGYGVERVHTYRNETYIICAEGIPETDYETITEQTSLRAYRFRNGEYELIAENFISYTFADGGFWYHPFEIEYYGTVMSPTGKGSETAPADIIRNTNNMLTRVDLADGSTKTWAFDRFDEGYVPLLYGISDGAAIVSMSSPKLWYENYENGGYHAAIHKYQLNDDGTVTDLGEFKK